MGLGTEAIAILLELRAAGHIVGTGAVMELGAQQLANAFLNSRARLQELADLFGVTSPHNLPEPTPTYFAHGQHEHLAAAAPRAERFWRWLGYDYSAIDIDGSPGSVPLDLNYDSVPAAEIGKYQIVTNFGTTEHIANQLNAFQVIHDLTALGGIMIHQVPAQGMMNHGLVNYNHKFFWMLARSNGYQLLKLTFGSEDLSYALPDNIRENDSAAGTNPHLESYRTIDCSLFVVLKKVYDIPYVAPIDVATGTVTDNETLRRRYWTVFEPDAFEKIEPNIPSPGRGRRGRGRYSVRTGNRTLKPRSRADRRCDGTALDEPAIGVAGARPRKTEASAPMNDLQRYATVFDGIEPWAGYVPKRFIADFLGQLIDIEFHPMLFTDPAFDGEAVGGGWDETALPDLGKVATPADAEAWFEAVDWVVAAREARDRFTMITLGANYGAQAIGAYKALQAVNPLPCKLVAVEPVPENVAWIERHMRNNGIDPAQQWIVPLAISDTTAPLFFPVGGAGIGSNNCYSTNEPAARHDYAEGFIRAGQAEAALRNLLLHNTTGLTKDLAPGHDLKGEIKLISAITLAELLGPFDRVDYLESDIQQSEILVFPPFIELLGRKVRRIHIGTHGGDVHEALHTLFANNGWEIVFSYAPNGQYDSPFGGFETNDGVLTVRNPRL